MGGAFVPQKGFYTMAKKADLLDEAKKLGLSVTEKNTIAEIEAAIAKNIIRKSRNVYYYGTDVIGKSLEDTVDYLDNKNNQDLKLTILQETESK